MDDAALILDQVTKTYGDFTAVKDISLRIPRGALYGFLGPNGAGKTTTLRMILDIIRPSCGSIAILGSPSAQAVRHRIGYLPEEKGLYKKMRVVDIITYFAMLKGMERHTARKKAQSLLSTYGLKDFADAKVESLSKGMGQKVQVLSAVAHEPELVILDEPFSGLDPVNQQVLENLIQDLRARGSTVIFSTHVMSHAERLCDHILLIAKGSKIFDGTIAQAKALIPRRVLLATRDDVQRLQGSDVRQLTPLPGGDGEPGWLLHLSEHGSAQQVLKNCFELGINLSRFEYSDASLHDVFVHLVGQDAAEHRLR
ncbi:MAG: hypothetical protein RLZZ385_1288 [Pseudomonadota bacterium]